MSADPHLSIVICTLNEEGNVQRLVKELSWANELLIVDSGSTDSTKQKALALGVRVEECAWRGFSAQKNEGARRAKNDWILSLDADEIVTKRLRDAIIEVMESNPDPRDGYSVDRRGDFLGRILPNSSRRSKRLGLTRLYNKRFSSWDEGMPVHEIVRVSGRAIPLKGRLLHVNDLKIGEYADLFNRYATLESQDLAQRGHKATWIQLAVRPALRFIWHYAWCGEWRLGRRGLCHSYLKSYSDALRYMKLYERELNR